MKLDRKKIEKKESPTGQEKRLLKNYAPKNSLKTLDQQSDEDSLDETKSKKKN